MPHSAFSISVNDAPLPWSSAIDAARIRAHEVENGAQQLVPGVPLRKVVGGRMHGELGRRQGEDQPAATSIDAVEPKDVVQEPPIGVGVGAIEQEMHSVDGRHDSGDSATDGHSIAGEPPGQDAAGLLTLRHLDDPHLGSADMPQ